MKKKIELKNKKRYAGLDQVRGMALFSMIAYHGTWDLVYLFGFDWPWYQSELAYFWQQSICWTFLFLSGFCQPLGKRKLKRGIAVFLCGCLVSMATLAAMPENRVLFGVLTLIGSCMLLMIPGEGILGQIPPSGGFLASFALFVMTKEINSGYLGFGNWTICRVPDFLYRNLLTAYFGFPAKDFYSTDYFPLLPWLFLFLAGYFAYYVFQQKKWLGRLDWNSRGIGKVFEWLGRHSLAIYLAHQPLLYFIFCLLFGKL